MLSHTLQAYVITASPISLLVLPLLYSDKNAMKSLSKRYERLIKVDQENIALCFSDVVFCYACKLKTAETILFFFGIT